MCDTSKTADGLFYDRCKKSEIQLDSTYHGRTNLHNLYKARLDVFAD